MSETDIRLEIEKIKRSLDNQDKNIELVFQCLDELNDKIKRPPLSPDRVMVGIRLGEMNNELRIKYTEKEKIYFPIKQCHIIQLKSVKMKGGIKHA